MTPHECDVEMKNAAMGSTLKMLSMWSAMSPSLYFFFFLDSRPPLLFNALTRLLVPLLFFFFFLLLERVRLTRLTLTVRSTK